MSGSEVQQGLVNRDSPLGSQLQARVGSNLGIGRYTDTKDQHVGNDHRAIGHSRLQPGLAYLNPGHIRPEVEAHALGLKLVSHHFGHLLGHPGKERGRSLTISTFTPRA